MKLDLRDLEPGTKYYVATYQPETAKRISKEIEGEIWHRYVEPAHKYHAVEYTYFGYRTTTYHGDHPILKDYWNEMEWDECADASQPSYLSERHGRYGECDHTYDPIVRHASLSKAEVEEVARRATEKSLRRLNIGSLHLD